MLKSLSPTTLAALDGLTLRARHIIEGFVAGSHRSPFQGSSVEFSEYREYVQGDEIRHVDWKAYGRTDKLFVKRYVDETNLHAYLVLDQSASMSYRSGIAPLEKLEYAKCVLAALAWLMLRKGDSIGVALADTEIQQWLPAASHHRHWDRILEVFENPQEDGESLLPDHKKQQKRGRALAGTDLGSVLNDVAGRLPQRSVVVVASDFLDDLEPLLAAVEQLRLSDHDVVLFQVLDRDEVTFPFTGNVKFEDLELFATTELETNSVRQEYLELFEQAQDELTSRSRNLGAGFQCVVSDEDFGQALHGFLTSYAAQRRSV
ncbi:MAG: DUF58 domain-containing protein [Planctomycetaceae bacterium]|nr:DUF58 domain-containing protein [Planctomycetaceae bacterium]